MANNVNITIGADARKAENALKKFQDNVRKAGLALSAMGAVGALAIKGFTSAALEQERALKTLSAVIENTGESFSQVETKILAATSALQNKSNFGDEAQIRVLAKLVPMLGSTDAALAALPAALELAAVTGKDLNSVVDTMGPVLAGVTDRIRGTTLEFTAGQGPAERLAQIMDVLGGSAEADIDPFIQLQNAVGDLSEKIGDALLPIVVPLVEKLKNLAVQIQTVNPLVIQWGTGILAAATALGLLGGPLLLIISSLPKLIFGLKGVVLAFKSLTFVMMRNPIIAAITALVIAVGLFAVAWQKNMGGIRDFTRDIFVKIGTFIQGGVNIVTKGINALIRAFNLLPGVTDIPLLGEKNFDFGAVFDNAVKAVDDFSGDIAGKLKGLGNDITDFIIPPPELLGAGLHSIKEEIVEVGNVVEGVGERSEETFRSIGRSAEKAGRAIAEMRSGAATDLGRKATGQLGEIFQNDSGVIAGNVNPLLDAFKIAGIDTKAVQSIVQQEGTRVYGGDTQRASNKLIEALNINFSGLNTDDPQAVADLVAKEIERVLGEHLIRNSANRSY